MLFRLLFLFHVCMAFPLKCPEQAQWSFRARALCPDPSKYSCLKNDLINGFSENCTISDFQQPGRKGVLRGGLDADICLQERYHPWPITYYTNVSTGCIFLKSACNEEGQVVYGKGNRNTDTTCSCDYTRGYDFLAKPRHPCFCVPLREDCSCYLKTCLDSTYIISSDYKCIHMNSKINTSIENCQPIFRERVIKEENFNQTEDITRSENSTKRAHRTINGRITVTVCCIAFFLVYCINELLDKFYWEDSTQGIDPRPVKDDMEQNANICANLSDCKIRDTDFNNQRTCSSQAVDGLGKMTLYTECNATKEGFKKDWMTKKLEQWEDKEKNYFVNTNAIGYVLDCIKQHVCVSVVGPSGVGKTFLVHHVALEMKNIGYIIMEVKSPKEMKKYYSLDRKTLFVVDDMCGNCTANKKELNKWKKSINDITPMLDKQSCKLILTCRLQVFQDEEFKHTDLKLFQTCICNLVDEKHALTISEKREFANTYFQNTDINNLKHLFQYDFFPFLCQMYDIRDKSNFSEEEFLKDPFDFCKDELSNLLLDCKYKFVALFLVVLCNNHLEEKVLTDKDDKVRTMLDHILEEIPINQFCIVEFKKELEVLTQTFVVNENGTYHTMHDKLFDFLAYYFGKKYKRLLIKHADIDLINARCVIDPVKSDKTKNEEYVIDIQDDNLQLYGKRVFDDMTKADYKMRLLCFNRNGYNETFQNTLCAIIQNLQKYEIVKLIETASSVFVRDMFVMDVNDIKLDRYDVYTRYGILLDKVHLEKYIERMFIDMTTSDDVNFYMERSRCCRNEVFFIDLVTYMTSISSPKIKKLIKSANTSFVQLMFVIETDDIKPNNPHVYKRYGIVIHDDVIKVYIERVFDDITRSEDVDAYLICNRNSQNTKFHTKLLDYMTQLDRTTIEYLIKNASRSFIYELCVMTTDDINENACRECKRYGVIIPDECIQMYVDRWFDEMAKSQNISTYFEENRNGQTNKFQTALLTYMTELQDTNIEKLIKAASEDFLHKMIVTTTKHIQNDSTREFEHYGVVLQDKHLDMYTERIFYSNDFIKNIKCNRTMKCVLKCMSKLGESKLIELIQESNETVFHQMITVDIENEFRSAKMNSDCQSDDIVKNMLETKEGPITCPVRLLSLYMDRMISDWGKGEVYAVVKNKNLKNQYFVDKFLDHLNLLEPSKIKELVNIKDNRYNNTTLRISCTEDKANLAKWCLEKHVHENPGQKHTRLFALFLVVIFNNQLEETIISDEFIKKTAVKFSFRKMLNIRKDISAREVKEELNTSLQIIGVDREKGVYSVRCDKMSQFLVFYFLSIRQMSKILVKFADEKFLCKWFLSEKSLFHKNKIIIPLPDEEYLTCINRVLTKMTNSEEFIRYILNNKTNVNLVTAYVRKLNVKEILTIFENSCIDFIMNFCVLAANETQDHSDEESILSIVIPNDYIPIYIKRIFNHISNNGCVEACLKDNKNSKNEIFHAKLLSFMKGQNIDDVEKLIYKASSDFTERMFVISEEDIKPESCWEYERYGIVIPEELLQNYIKRVLSDMTKSVNVPVNRNSENNKFQDTLYSYTSSFSETELISLLDTASSKFIRRMFLSTEEESEGSNTQRYENYHMCIPKMYFRPGSKTILIKRNNTSLTEDDPSTFTIITNEYINSDIATVTVRSKISIDNFQQLLSKYIDPIFICKIMKCIVRFPKLLVGKYIQRMVADWIEGNVHDVFWNINLSTQSFRSNFLTHLKNTEKSTQEKLTKTTDNQTGDSALAVSCRVGIIELVEWCLVNNANTNSNNGEHPLYIACNQNRPDIVYSLLHSKVKADVNESASRFSIFPLYEACKNGNEKIVSMLLMENANVNNPSNLNQETPLYIACKYGHIKVVSLLLDHKANYIDINNGDSIERTPLYIACKRGHTDIVSLLLYHKANHIDINKAGMKREKSPLYIACKRGHSQIVSLLLNYDGDEADMYKAKYNQETPLFAACKGGHTDIVRLLLEKEIRVINISTIDGASPLYIACQEGHDEVVCILLNHKCIEVDKCMLIGMSPLFIASFLGHTKIVKSLLGRRADANICVKRQTILIEIFEKFERVYKNPRKVDPNKYNNYIRKLVRENASKHVQSYIGGKEVDWVFNSIFEALPLHMGSLMGNTEIVKLLIERNSQINCLSENGSTPLSLACEFGHEDIAHVLLANGADPTLDRKGFKSPLTIARDNGHTKIVEIIKSHTVMSSNN